MAKAYLGDSEVEACYLGDAEVDFAFLGDDDVCELVEPTMPPSKIMDFNATDNLIGSIKLTWTNATGTPPIDYFLYDGSGEVLSWFPNGYNWPKVGVHPGLFIRAENDDGFTDSNIDSGTGIAAYCDGCNNADYGGPDSSNETLSAPLAGAMTLEGTGYYVANKCSFVHDSSFSANNWYFMWLSIDGSDYKRYTASSSSFNIGIRPEDNGKSIKMFFTSGGSNPVALTSFEAVRIEFFTISTTLIDIENSSTDLSRFFRNAAPCRNVSVSARTKMTLSAATDTEDCFNASAWETIAADILDGSVNFDNVTFARRMFELVGGIGHFPDFALPLASNVDKILARSTFSTVGDITFLGTSNSESSFESMPNLTNFGSFLNKADFSGGDSNRMFQYCDKLTCIQALRGSFLRDAKIKTNMFNGCTSLVAPTAAEQADILANAVEYINPGTCI